MIKNSSLVLVCFWRNDFRKFVTYTKHIQLSWTLVFNTLFFLANSTEISTKSSSLLVQFCWKFPLNEPVIVASFPSSVNISSHYLFRILEFFLLRIWSLVIFCHNFILLWTALNFSWCFINPIFPTLLLNSTW